MTMGLISSSLGRAEPLSIQPTVGVATDYSSNPYLLPAGGHSVSDAALLISAPASYDADALHLSLSPSIRYSTSGSYASLESNYFRLSGGAQYTTDVDTVSLTSSIGRDSSLYQSGLKSGGVGVRSDSDSAAGDWQRVLTSRAVFDLNIGWNRVLYDQTGDEEGLVDYRYLSEGSSASYAYNELTTLQLTAGAGQYTALNGNTRSQNYSLSLGMTRQLTEDWTLVASAGYAKSNNSVNLYEGPFLVDGVVYGPYFVGTAKSSQQGPVYNLNLTHQGETVTVALTGSRAYRPSGFEYLSRTDAFELDVTRTLSERWSLGTALNYTNVATPYVNGSLASLRYFNPQFSANYHWTPTWTLSLRTNWTKLQNQEPPPQHAASTSVSLEISRKFLRIDL
jgi:hypothetical protein